MESAMREPEHQVPDLPLIMARARAARTRAMHDLLRGLFGLLLRVPFTIVAGWRAVALWHTRRRAMRELNEFDDRALHDMGIRRSEIETAVFGRPR
jgi:uncharacterized protein YjiS (DUF1127 family)